MEYLTVTEAAEALQLSVPTIKRYIYSGELKSAKLPGGQHRIPRGEIDRLLTPTDEAAGAGLAGADATCLERLTVLERWVTEVQSEVERLGAALEVVSSYCKRFADAEPAEEKPSASGGHRLFVLGMGCRKCIQLYELTRQTLAQMGREDVPVEHVKNPDDIAAYGPVLTPALVVDDTVVLSGRVPAEVALRDILDRHLK